MKRFLLSILTLLCVTLSTQAMINVWTTSINGENGYGIYDWSNPGDLAAFLNGTYEGTVNLNGVADANWQTDLLPNILDAKAVKLGGGSSNETVNTADLQSLSNLTDVVYLRMDNCSPASGADFSQIAIGSADLLDITLPTGVTKAQVQQANDALLATATGLNLTTGVTGSTKVDEVPHYWYTLPGSTTPIEYLGEVAEGQTSVTVTDYAVMADLTLVEGYPKSTYINTRNHDKVTETKEGDVFGEGWQSNVVWPAHVEQALEEASGWADLNGNKYPLSWWISETGVVQNGGGSQYGLSDGTQLTATTIFGYKVNSWDSELTVYNGTVYTDDNGSYGLIDNSNKSIGFNFTTSYQYTYIDKNGETQTLTQSVADEDGKIQIDTYTGELALTTTIEEVSSFSVDGVAACVNNAGSLPDATDFLYTNDQATAYKSAQTITIFGNVDNDDLAYLSETNFASAKLIDVSETTLADGATYGSLNDAPLVAALFLPNTVTREELVTLESTYKTDWDAGHTCAYVASEDENGNKLMHVYAWDATVANLAPVVDNQTGLYFLKRYTATGDAWAGAVYTSGNEPFRLALADLNAVSMDFTNYNAIMMPDFSHLSADTHYLVVPQNTADGQDAHNFTLDTSASNYKYTENIWVVSTYKAVGVSSTYADKTLTATETTNITYFRSADKLAGAAPFLSDQQKTASLQIFVTKDGVQLSEGDMEALQYVQCNKMNFLDADVADNSWKNLTNPYVQYVALPDNKNSLVRDNVHLDNNTNEYTNPFPYLTNLKSVASYDTQLNMYTAYSSKNLDENGKQIASVGYVTEMIKPSTASNRFQKNSTFAAGLKHMEMMGYFTPEDLSTDGDYYAHAGLNTATVEWIDLSKAYFPTKSDMAFAYNAAVTGSVNNHYGWDNKFFYHIDLPTHEDMDELPPAFLDNMSVLGGGTTHSSLDDGATAEWHSVYSFDYPEPGTTYEGVCIPSNVKYIRTYAFNGCNRLNHIYTTAAANDEDLGVDAGAYDNGPNTFTFSTNLKEIETGAFWCGGDNGSGHDGVWSVYPLSKQAPKCQTRSFSPKVLMNKNGFNPAHPICIDSYQDGQQGMAILRYPNGLPEDLEKLYTDITRIFSLADETGATDGDGNLIYWPTQTEFDRSYQQGQLGYLWEDWDMTMMWGQYQKMVHGFGTDDVSDFAATTEAEYVTSGDGVHYTYQDFLDDVDALRAYFKDYIGWHEFVLAWPGRTYNQDTQKDEEYIELDWYTFCVPVDMTVADVAKYMGVVKASTDPNIANKYVTRAQKTNRNNSEEAAFTDYKTLVTWDYVLPDIRQLKSIERNLTNGNINLHLSLDLAGQYPFEQKIMVPSTIKKDENVEGNEESRFTFAYNSYVDAANADTAVIIKGGFPYLVKPIVPTSMRENYPGPGKFVMARLDVNDEKYDYKDGKNYFGYYKVFNGNKVRLPYEEYMLQATNPADDGAKEFVEGEVSKGEYLYNFIGRYVDDLIPQYSYYMGVAKNGTHKFYRATTTKKKWSAFSAIIAPLGSATYSYGEVGEKTADPNGTQSSYNMEYEGTTDDTVSQEGYGKFTFIFDDTKDEWAGETDGIKTIENQDAVVNANKVYNVNGQYVGSSLQGLGKGLYIMNGKKYVVK